MASELQPAWTPGVRISGPRVGVFGRRGFDGNSVCRRERYSTFGSLLDSSPSQCWPLARGWNVIEWLSKEDLGWSAVSAGCSRLSGRRGNDSFEGRRGAYRWQGAVIEDTGSL